MDQTTTFSPHLVCELLDGTRIRFARVKNKMWAQIAAEMNAVRIRRELDAIDADKTLKPRDAAELRMAVLDSIVPIHAAMDRCMADIEWTEKLLTISAEKAGHSADEAAKALELIPTHEQLSIARQISMLAVVKNQTRGTDENPLKPGVDLAHQNDSIGEKPADSSDTSSTSTPANSPTENSSST